MVLVYFGGGFRAALAEEEGARQFPPVGREGDRRPFEFATHVGHQTIQI